jgi:hypothetical protein
MSFKSQKIRDYPRDLDVVCANCGNPECCWAHLPYHDAGMGQKTDDYFGAPLCQQCHDYADGRAATDATGHNAGGRLDFEWRYRVLRAGIRGLWANGIIGVLE